MYEAKRRETPNFLSKLWIGPVWVVLLDDVDSITKVFWRTIQKPWFYHIMSKTPGDELLQQTNLTKWSKHRKIIGTSFRFFVLKLYTQIFFEEATILAKKMKDLATSKQAFEAENLVGLATLNALLRSSFGVDFEIQQNYLSEHPYLEAVDTSFQIFLLRVLRPWLLIDFFYSRSGYKAQAKKSRSFQKDFISSVIERIKTKIRQEKETSLKSKEDGSEKLFVPFVELVLRDKIDPHTPHGNFMSDRDLIQEMGGILNAGFGTVKTTISIILNLLAVHPNIQEDVYNEIQAILGNDPDKVPTYEQLQKLDLLNRVIKETMRLYPAVPIVARSSPEELHLCGYTIPAGVTIAVFIYGLHRHPQHWPNPEQFNPDRFLPSESSKRHPNAFMPFSLGARNCLGYKYAMLQMKVTVSTILRRYKVLVGDRCKTVEDIRFQFGLTLKTLPGNDIKLEPR
ncbi:hypothetical protein M8J77_011430 [Diaphorina citri]|nr:hypothetical protein M8J77_011430 [Diaphorina citri]